MMGWGPNATNTWIETNVTAACDDPTSNGNSIWMNAAQNFYCVKEANLSINQVNPDNYFSISNSYNFSNDFQDFTFSNNKIILSTGVDTRGVGWQVFDTLTSIFECQVDATDSDEFYYSSFTAIDGSFIVATNEGSDEIGYAAINCTDNTNVTLAVTFDFNPAATTWIVLNDSSVLLSVLKDTANINFFALNYDNGTWTNGTVATYAFNPNFITTSLTQQINDTYFLSAYQDGTGANWLGLFYVDENLNIVEASSINLAGYAANIASIIQPQPSNGGAIINFNGVPPQGSSQTPVPVAFTMVNLTNFTVGGGGPIHGYANYPGFRFGNSSFVDFSLIGVWVSTMGGSRTFYPFPIWDYYISPANDDIIWGMYTPSYYQLNGLTDCYLVQIQKSTQTVSKIVLNTTCPCSPEANDDGYWFTLGDVFVDASGNYNAAYRCNSNHYGVVAGNQSYLIEDVDLTAGGQDPLLFPQYQKGILNVVDFSTVGDVNLKTFNASNGSLISTTQLAHSTSSNQTGFKISSDLLVFTNKPTQIGGITPITLYSIGQKSSLFQFMVPSGDLDGIIPLAFDPNTFPYVFLYATSFASQPLFVYTPQSEATLTGNLITGSVPIQYVDNSTFTYTSVDQWIGDYYIYNATANFINVPLSAGFLGASMLLLLALLGLLL